MVNRTVDALLRAMEEFQDVGLETFLERYDLNPPRTTFISYQGQDYPAKAIWVAAHVNMGVKTRRHTTPIEGWLADLGFDVVKRLAGERVPVSGRPSNETAASYFEGEEYRLEVKLIRRNASVVKIAKARSDSTCKACKFNFLEHYGTIGEFYIEAHHPKPLSTSGGEMKEVTPDDFIMLCANCHRMAHQRAPMPYSVVELQAMMKSAKKSFARRSGT